MDLSPLPILDAAERYRGTFVDLDAPRMVAADSLHRARAQLAERLRREGIARGQRVVVAVGNGPQFVAALLAVLTAGGSPLLVHAKTPGPELKRTALRFGARAVLTDECPAADLQAEALAVVAVSAGDWLELLLGKIDARSEGFCADFVDLPG
ncbi:MAG: AMP-binding protein, partial [Pirellulales bacterium]